MTVPVETIQITYTGDGSSKNFAVPFYFIAQSDLEVIVGLTNMTLNSDYTVTGALDPKLNVYSAGGTIQFTIAPASGAQVFITRRTPQTQPATFNPGDPQMAGTVEEAYDRLCVLIQELAANIAVGLIGILPGPPTSGNYTKGQWFIVSPPVAGQPFIWACTVSGNPGIWNAIPLGL
jgi:hypothetical protein